MTRTEHLIACLAEECDEVGQRCMKALRFGLDEVQPGQPPGHYQPNRERIAVEVDDLLGVIHKLEAEGILPRRDPERREEENARKSLRVERFLDYATRLGTVRP